LLSPRARQSRISLDKFCRCLIIPVDGCKNIGTKVVHTLRLISRAS
jgi:hypothetical protein